MNEKVVIFNWESNSNFTKDSSYRVFDEDKGFYLVENCDRNRMWINSDAFSVKNFDCDYAQPTLNLDGKVRVSQGEIELDYPHEDKSGIVLDIQHLWENFDENNKIKLHDDTLFLAGIMPFSAKGEMRKDLNFLKFQFSYLLKRVESISSHLEFTQNSFIEDEITY